MATHTNESMLGTTTAATQSPEKRRFEINNFTFWIGLVITAVIGSGIWLAIHIAEVPYDVDDISSLYTCLVIVFTLLYYSKSLHNKYDYFKQNAEREEARASEQLRLKKLHYTYDTADDWYLSPLETNRKNLRRVLEIGDGSAILAHLQQNRDDEEAILNVLNYFEYLSVLIQRDLVDSGALQDIFKTLFVEVYRNLEEYIKYRQRVRGPRIYKSFINVSSHWANS